MDTKNRQKGKWELCNCLQIAIFALFLPLLFFTGSLQLQSPGEGRISLRVMPITCKNKSGRERQVRQKSQITNLAKAILYIFVFPLFFFTASAVIQGSGEGRILIGSMNTLSYGGSVGQVESSGKGGMSPVGYYSGVSISGLFSYPNLTKILEQASLKVELISPLNNSARQTLAVTLRYNLTGEFDSCQIYIDPTHNWVDYNPTNGINNLNSGNLTAGKYSWYVSCIDSYNNAHSSGINYFTIFKKDNFDNESTDLTSVDLSAVPKLTFAKSGKGKIVFATPTDLRNGADFDIHVKIGKNSIVVDSASLPYLNKTATLTLYNFSYQNPVIWKDGNICSSCTLVSNSGGILSFNVTGFSNYTVTPSTKLLAYDSTDFQIRYINQSVNFFANYTDIITGVPISGDCSISFYDSGWSLPVAMSFDSEKYVYSTLFMASGSKYFRANCSTTVPGYDALTATDSFYVSNYENYGRDEFMIDRHASSRYDGPGQSSQNIEDGNISSLNYYMKSQTDAWQGFYGNISAMVSLKNVDGLEFYHWGGVGLRGIVMASRSFNIDWLSINCTTPAGIATENAFLEKTSQSADSVTNTYPLTDHPSFVIGILNLTGCPSIKANGPDSLPDTDFWNVLISDDSGSGDLIYSNVISQDTIGFDNSTVDFQLMVGAKPGQLTPYYFYLEIQ